MLPTLDARLAAAAELVRPGEPVADIGCDHGKLTAVLAASARHDALRRWLWEHGFSFAADRPVQAAGRWYVVMAAEYTGRVYAPTFAECLFGSTGEWPEGKGYADWQKGNR